MKILFLRHGLTSGNLEKRYIGKTDEPLCDIGAAELGKLKIQGCKVLICSPMKRCIQTVAIVFPNQTFITEPLFRECDFGSFEGKNYKELSDSPDYQRWIDSNGNLPFPDGESPQEFRTRCTSAFDKLVGQYSDRSSLAFVVHGGTIMAILEKYAVPHKDYFEWSCQNGHGYICEWDGSHLTIMEKL